MQVLSIHEWLPNLHNYFDYYICLSIRPVVSGGGVTKFLFSLKLPWSHPLTPVVDPGIDPGYPRGTQSLRRS